MKKILKLMEDSITTRNRAGEILHKLASHGSYGGFPKDVTMEEVGWAIARTCINSPEPSAFREFMRGVKRYRRETWKK
jgi:hypothetical protein